MIKIIKYNELDEKTKNFFCLESFIAIKRHHSNLKSFEFEFNELEISHYPEWKLIPEQLSDIFRNNEIMDEIAQNYENSFKNEKISINIDYLTLINLFKQIKEKLRSLPEIIAFIEEFYNKFSFNLFLKGNLEYFLLFQLCFSILIDSDKKIASQVNTIERLDIDDSIINNFVIKINKNSKSSPNLNS
jgi:hypothetical protein